VIDYRDMWDQCAVAALIGYGRVQPPRHVYVVLADGRELPCCCTFDHVDSEGYVVWSATPDSKEELRADDVLAVLADLQPGTAIEFEAVVDSGRPHRQS
jgi:hypothetical protein